MLPIQIGKHKTSTRRQDFRKSPKPPGKPSATRHPHIEYRYTHTRNRPMHEYKCIQKPYTHNKE